MLSFNEAAEPRAVVHGGTMKALWGLKTNRDVALMWTLTIKGWNQLPDLLCAEGNKTFVRLTLTNLCWEAVRVFLPACSLHMPQVCWSPCEKHLGSPETKRCCPPLKHSHQLEQWVICSVHRALRARETWHNFIQPNCNLIVFTQIRWTPCGSIHHADTQISQHDTWVSDETA